VGESPDVDAVIIGAGVIGSAVALELSRRGLRTLSVDALPAAGFGSTSYSSAIVRFSYSTPIGVRMAWEGLHYWRDWPAYLGVDDERGLARLETCGMVLLDSGSGYAGRVGSLYEELGIPHERWDADELARRQPLVDGRRMGPAAPVDSEAFWAEPGEPLAGALWSPDAGYVTDPQLASHNLQRAAEAHGAAFRFRTRVTSIERQGERVAGVTLDDGSRVRSRVVVNVGGPESARVTELAGLTGSMKIATRPMRQEVHHLPAPQGADGRPFDVLLTDDDLGFYAKPEAGGMLAIGSLEPACDDLEWLEEPDHYHPTVTQAGWERQTLRLARRVPDVRIPHRPVGIVGIYDVADDWIPVYDRTDLDGFYVALGTSGNQFKNAAIAGHCLAELVTAVEAGHDHDADPLVVTGPYTGAELDLGAFSRNRSVNSESSFTVLG
jgi:sarcosine oxidase subunit beta